MPRMKGLMDAEGLPYGRRTHTYNSRLAQELGKWADTQPGGEAIHDALYRAYFVDARNIGDPDILVEIAQSVGLPADEARAGPGRAPLQGRGRRRLGEIAPLWRHRRPDLCRRRYGVVGAQPYEVLEQLVEKAGAARRTEPRRSPLLAAMPGRCAARAARCSAPTARRSSRASS